MSEEDDSASGTEEGFFFAAAAPGVATTVTVAAQAKEAAGRGVSFAGDEESATSNRSQFVSSETETETDLQRRDFASDFAGTPRGAAEPGAEAALAMFAGPAEQPERDLDVPTFLRRHKF
jgi:hypothetical protein